MAVIRRGFLPRSVALVLIGTVIGQLWPGIRAFVSSDIVLLLFVPGLVFDAAFELEWPIVRSLLAPLLALAVPGVVMSAAVVAIALAAFAGLPLGLAFVIGAITSATDPVAVVATLARSGMPRRLRTLVEGESLLNDGTGLVLVAIAIDAVTRGLGASGALVLFAITVVVSVAAGLAAGLVGAVLVRAALRTVRTVSAA